IYLGSLDGGGQKRLAAADDAGAYLPSGMIVFMRHATLMSQHLDVRRGELTEDPIRLAESVGSNNAGLGGLSTSADGRIAYRSGGAVHQLKWYDRTGKALGEASEPDANTLLYLDLSPDGQHVAFQRSIQNNIDVYLSDLVPGTMRRFTFDTAADTA